MTVATERTPFLRDQATVRPYTVLDIRDLGDGTLAVLTDHEQGGDARATWIVPADAHPWLREWDMVVVEASSVLDAATGHRVPAEQVPCPFLGGVASHAAQLHPFNHEGVQRRCRAAGWDTTTVKRELDAWREDARRFWAGR